MFNRSGRTLEEFSIAGYAVEDGEEREPRVARNVRVESRRRIKRPAPRVPPMMRTETGEPDTTTARYLRALVEHFGAHEVGTWDVVRRRPGGPGLHHVWCNGARYLARYVPGEGWVLYADPAFDRTSRDTSEWRCRAVRVGTSPALEGLVMLVREVAPSRPPEGWTYADWSRRNAVPGD